MPAAQPTRVGKKHAAGTQKAGDSRGPLQWVRRLFTKPLKLKRIGQQWHVVFDQTKLQGANTTSSPGRGEALRQAHLALQTLLKQHDDARQVVPHLSHLEQTLARNGSRTLKELPVKVLQRAMDQLDTIESGPRSDALMSLRMRVEEAIRRRSPVNLKGDIANMEVKDVSVSQFDEAEVSWTNRMELDAIYAEAGATK